MYSHINKHSNIIGDLPEMLSKNIAFKVKVTCVKFDLGFFIMPT